jgi:hypothetical protein
MALAFKEVFGAEAAQEASPQEAAK